MQETFKIAIDPFKVDKLEAITKKIRKLGVGATYAVGEIRDGDFGPVVDATVVLDASIYQTEKARDLTYLGAISIIDNEAFVRGNINVPLVAERARNWQNLTCDHCHQNRLRKQYYLFQNPDGQVISIGSTCVKEYFGVDLTKLFNALAPLMLDEDGNLDPEYWGTDRTGKQYPSIFMYYALTKYATEDFRKEWVSKAKADETYSISTGEVIRDAMSSIMANTHTNTISSWYTDAHNEYLRVRDEGLPADFLEGMRKLASLPYETNDFAYNLHQALFDADGNLRQYPIGKGLAGYGCWKAMQLAREVPAEEAPAILSEYVGTIGERVDLTLKVLKCKMIETMYGMSCLYIFSDEAGHRFKSFVSGSFSADENDTVTIKATIKDHTEYKELKETMLSRIKAV